MALQKQRGRVLVLGGRERAGRIDEPAAGLDGLGRVVQNPALTHGARLHVRGRPFLHGARVLAEHALPGARRIAQHRVEPFGKPVAKGFGVHVRYDGVRHAEPFEVADKHLRAGRDVFVGNEHVGVLHRGGKLRRFAARRGAKVEHRHAGAHVQKSCRRLRARLLHIVQPRRMQRIGAGLEAGRNQKAVRGAVNRNKRRRKQRLQRVRRDFQRVHAKRAFRRLVHRGKVGGIGLPELRLHTGQKFLRKNHFYSFPSAICTASLAFSSTTYASLTGIPVSAASASAYSVICLRWRSACFAGSPSTWSVL